MGTGSLLAPIVVPKLFGPVTPGKGKYAKALVATAVAAVAATTLADLVARMAADDETGTTQRPSRRRRARRAAQRAASVGGVVAVVAGGVAVTTTLASNLTTDQMWNRRITRDLGTGPAAVAAAILGWDFIYYWNHRFMHESRYMWAVHVVHHSSERYKPVPLDDLATLLAGHLQATSAYEVARSLTIVGTAFPSSMGEIKGPTQLVPRREWLLYKALVDILPPHVRIPTFGDYAIAAPELVQGDMRLLKPAATVRYTTNDAWLIAKGSNVRDNGFEQYRTHCDTVASSPSFQGAGFSPGGDYISQCAAGRESTGNLTTWRWVGTNQHLTKVVADLANF